MDWFAHRGFDAVNPENTLAAFRAAVEAGVDGIELDLRRCRDALVVVHDANVDRVTDASGPVSSFTADELADLSVLGSGEGIPTFESVCRTMPGDICLNVELKSSGLARETVELAHAHDRTVVLSSFDPDTLSTVTDVPRALLFYENPEEGLARARTLDCEAVHPHWHLCTESLLERAHESGFDVIAWTVEYRGLVEELADLGVDGFIADDPAYCCSGEHSDR